MDILKRFNGKNENPGPDENQEEQSPALKVKNPEDFAYEELPPVKEGEVNFHSAEVSPASDGLLVGFFISNGLDKKLVFDKLPLALTDSQKRLLARQIFEGEVIGDVAPGTAKACMVRFLTKNIYTEDIPEKCLVLFDANADLTEASQEAEQPQLLDNSKFQIQGKTEKLSKEQQQELELKLATLPVLKEGEVNIAPFQIQVTPQRGLRASAIIRNGTDQTLNLAQLPLAILDAENNEIARGQFTNLDLTIEPYKAVVWSFLFDSFSDATLIDLSSWYFNLLPPDAVNEDSTQSSSDVQ